MERYADLTKERLLNLKARVNEASVPTVLTFVNSDGSPHDISSYDFEIPVKKIPTSSTNLFTLTEGDGLTVHGASSNELLVEISEERATQVPNVYFWRLYSSSEDHTWLSGDLEFLVRKYDGTEDTTTIVISENGDEVTITISGQQSETAVYTVASTDTLTPDIDTYDSFEITAQAEALTIANPTGSIGNFEGFIIRLTDNGTSRAITYGNKFRAFGAALPTATTIGKTIYIICIYNSTDDVYDTASREEV